MMIKASELEMIVDKVEICAVTKNRSITEVEVLLKEFPQIRIIGENRWPDCEEKFKYFKAKGKQCHFIGRLQKNKVRKVLPLVDMIQSVDSQELLMKLEEVANDLNKPVQFLLQVNVSADVAKAGIALDEVDAFIEWYLAEGFKWMKLAGLMTIGAQTDLADRAAYFEKLHTKFVAINDKYFTDLPLSFLSMGMSEDYQQAINAGSTMVRLGGALFA